jgi:hypothetical protein
MSQGCCVMSARDHLSCGLSRVSRAYLLVEAYIFCAQQETDGPGSIRLMCFRHEEMEMHALSCASTCLAGSCRTKLCGFL